jgi:hypothetical protein
MKARLKMAAVATVAVAGVAMATAPAQAHTGIVNVSRGDCSYFGTSSHGEADTTKGEGDCKGHAWLRVKWNGEISSWIHDSWKARFTAPGLKGITVSDHKSCETCSYKTVKH